MLGEKNPMQPRNLLHVKLPSFTFGRLRKPIELFSTERRLVPKLGAPQEEQSGPISAMHPGLSARHANNASLTTWAVWHTGMVT